MWLDLGAPALDELHDLLHLELGEVKVVGQDLLAELHKDAAVDALAGEEADHVLGEANEAQALGDLLQREGREVSGGQPGRAVPTGTGGGQRSPPVAPRHRRHLDDALRQVDAGDATLGPAQDGRRERGRPADDDAVPLEPLGWARGGRRLLDGGEGLWRRGGGGGSRSRRRLGPFWALRPFGRAGERVERPERGKTFLGVRGLEAGAAAVGLQRGVGP